ncbi:xylulokinase [Cytobacillus gottheilii]|uniref:xylulokinase n=1 Tax=Cytobacillus gottheilii TaxID=859144 RepID=UPI0009BADFC6|nr:xylulokinase [Cytobacillus gottheilii]
MKYVIGIDLGTSAVKAILVDYGGIVHQTVSRSYPLIQEKSGFSEQDPEEWYKKTKEAVAELITNFEGKADEIEGISFSGQMHGLVLLDQHLNVLRNAILWNDTRTTKQCEEIYSVIGEKQLIAITKNTALEGFTLPKLLWVKEHERDTFDKINLFMLPKDYLRFRMTGTVQTDYSDAAGTLLLDVAEKKWSQELCEAFGIDIKTCPPLAESHAYTGTIKKEFAEETGLTGTTKVFTGAADNACGAIGAGILSEGKTLCSIGTSGVILCYEEPQKRDYDGKVHYFNHGQEDAYYSMGVTLSAGYSLSWFRDFLGGEESYDSLLKGIEHIPPAANGLLFTPYLVGERTPHADASIRSSFIGVDSNHTKVNFVRAVLEGVTFSLKETIDILRDNDHEINTIISIGGGAQNKTWLQMQADIFNAKVVKLASEQGPAMGAAILAAYGCGWYSSLQECSRVFISYEKAYDPIPSNVEVYETLYEIYKKVYIQTKNLNKELEHFR